MTNRVKAEPCRVDGCERGMQVGQLCDLHYRRMRRTGTTDAPTKPTFADRFWSKVEKTSTCWEWVGHVRKDGYGAAHSGGQTINAHRIAYELTKGSIPHEFEIDHLCRNRKCVNPDHLEAVPKRINILRGVGQGAKHARKTHCLHGHPLSGENIYPSQLPNRVCVTCARNYATARERRLRKQRMNGASK